MKIHTKLGLAALALALGCGPMLAQDGPQDEATTPGAEEMLGPGGPGGEAVAPPDNPAGPPNSGGPRGDRGWEGRRDGSERGGRRHEEFGLSRLLSNPDIQQKVGVTAEQVAKIKQQESAFRKSEIRERADVDVKRVELRDLLSADTPDRKAIDAKLQEVSTAQLAMEKSRVDFRLDMKEALTPDQRTKLRQALQDRWQNRGPRRGPGGSGQRGPNGPTPGADGQSSPN
ncbi:MAG TPA: Spy/CpxP family protein refolding chaperone [Verrucomicrobiae bacterium]|nr:Spy/CpxP family protein refolding chaperone [Verrucomicrobiae bacterium]